MKARTGVMDMEMHGLDCGKAKDADMGMSAELHAYVGKWHGRVFRTVAARIRGGYKGMVDSAQAEDIADEAVAYALGALAKQNDLSHATAEAWIALSMFKARHLANSIHRRRRSGRCVDLLVDAPFRGQDDGACPEAPCVVEASRESWRALEQDAARAASGAALYRNLDHIFRLCGVTSRAGGIFKAYYLERQPLEKVSRDFGASGNVVYVTTARVLKKLESEGRTIARGILACAA